MVIFHSYVSLPEGISKHHWWFFAIPLKNDGVKVSWDDDIPFPTEWKVTIHSCSSHHQSDHDFERMKNDAQKKGVM